MSTLTREQVLAMTAGLELDALVYRRIFGRPLLDAPGGAIGKRSWVKGGDGRTGPLPRYSTDIAAAWEVVEHYRTLWQTYPERPQPYEWHWEFQDFGGDGWLAEVRAEGSTQAECLALTFPLAVCRVALLLTLTEAA